MINVAVVDASGRYPSGVFAGSRYWLGSKERCLAMVSSTSHNLSYTYLPTQLMFMCVCFQSDDFVLNGHNETLTALRSNDYVTAIFRKEKNYESGKSQSSL